MGTIEPALDYQSPQGNPSTVLTFEETATSSRVIFGVKPAWYYIPAIVSIFVAGSATLVVTVLVVMQVWEALHWMGPTTQIAAHFRHAGKALILETSGTVGLLWLGAFVEIWLYRLFGRVPRILTATSEELFLSRASWKSMRYQSWPASEILGIDLHPVRTNLNWRRTCAILFIRKRSGGRLRFWLSSADPMLPQRIADGLRDRILRGG